jgi:uncharacterized protein (DUF305 family)
MGRDRESDQTYIRHMTTHPAQGIELARIGEQRASNPHLKVLARISHAAVG